ncbi:MAG: glycosyltransferase [Bryobacterales bacterium]|nr:glycosyltransferase [Bryobacterales bacterium]
MTILAVHNSYKERGGEDIVYERECRLLEEGGHVVHRFQLDNNLITPARLVCAGFSAIWAHGIYRRIGELIRETNCEVVHCHNTFPLISPSVYYSARAAGVPVVQTLHNYRLLCSNGLLFREGKVCESCINTALPLRGVVHRCYRQGYFSSASVAAMLSVHRWVRTWTKMVDLYIAPSKFCRDKYVQAGFEAKRIAVKPAFVHPDPGPGDHRGKYCLFVGRLSEEKGLNVLFDAWRSLGPSVRLKVVGDGPFAPLVAEAVREMPWIEWLGHRSSSEVLHLMGEASVLIAPSLWYETFGLVILEAFAKGTPAIVPQGGALAELVEHGRNGYHFDVSDRSELVKTVVTALGDCRNMQEMGRNARKRFVEQYTGAANTQFLVELYRRAIRQRAVPNVSDLDRVVPQHDGRN